MSEVPCYSLPSSHNEDNTSGFSETLKSTLQAPQDTMRSNSSFVNGIIVGAGAVMALMSVGFLYYLGPVENQQGISTTEIRVAILLGGIVAAVSLAYEFYTKKNEEKTGAERGGQDRDETGSTAETTLQDTESSETRAEPQKAEPETKQNKDEKQQDNPDETIKTKDTKESPDTDKT